MDWLSTTSNCLQIVQSLALIYVVGKWWKQVMANQKVIPTIVIIILIASIVVSGLTLSEHAGYWPHRTPAMINITNRHYDHETVYLDNHSYYNCTFENVDIHYAGAPVFFDADTKFVGTANFFIDSPEASRIISLMTFWGFLTKQPQASIHSRPEPEKP